jgi:hypothetical protein
MDKSAAHAVERYIKQYRLCRKLDADIYGRESAPVRISHKGIESGKRFALSELYGLGLDSNVSKVCFRSCRSGEEPTVLLGRFEGVFALIQTLMYNVCNTVNNDGNILHSYSKCLAVPLLRYSRGTELLVSELKMNTFRFGDTVVPFREVTSKQSMSRFSAEHFDDTIPHATISVCDCGLKELDRFCSDWNIPRFKKRVSYKKDYEVLTSLPPQTRFGNIDAIRRYYLAAILRDPLPELDCVPVTQYLADIDNLRFERECYISLTRGD